MHNTPEFDNIFLKVKKAFDSTFWAVKRDSLGLLVGEKSMNTAVGVNVAHASFEPWFDKLRICGIFETKGENVLDNTYVYLDLDADEGEINKAVNKFISEADAKIAGSWIMRISKGGQ